MKIVHICLTGAVTDGFSYQDNLLSKYHHLMGHDVSFITSQWQYNENGEIIHTDRECYYNEDGVYFIRLKNRRREKYQNKIHYFEGLTDTLIKENPDVLFIHGPQLMQMKEIVKYLKKHPTTVYVDNHADFSNSGRNFFSKNILHKILWRHMAHIINPYTKMFYGVLPSRVDWLTNIYNLPKEKCELLVMGADDDAVSKALNENVKVKFRESYGVKEDDFLIVTGGKIDSFKLQTLSLMQAVKNIDSNKVKLIVFGSVEENIKDKLMSLCDGYKIQYIGWVKGNYSYDIMASADMVIFPGRHSVYWEQAAGLGKPMICKYWEGTCHIDCGGNVKFIHEDSVNGIQSIIQEIIENPDEYERMLRIAKEKGKNSFSYAAIAQKSLK